MLENGQSRVFEESLEFSREGGFLLCDLKGGEFQTEETHT